MREQTPSERDPVMQLHVSGSGPTVVIVGGGLTGALSWVPHAEALSARRQVARAQPLGVQLALDGKPLPEGFGIRTETNALLRALDAREWKAPLDVVGWSYGGVVALDFALEHPGRIRSLTLIEPSAFWALPDFGRDDPELRKTEAMERRWKDGVSEDELAEFLIEAAIVPAGQSPREHPRWPIWARHRQALAAAHVQFEHRDDNARLRALGQPVLLVVGEGTTSSCERVIATLARDLPRARVLRLPGGHAAPLVSMDRFLEELTGFLDGASP